MSFSRRSASSLETCSRTSAREMELSRGLRGSAKLSMVTGYGDGEGDVQGVIWEMTMRQRMKWEGRASPGKEAGGEVERRRWSRRKERWGILKDCGIWAASFSSSAQCRRSDVTCGASSPKQATASNLLNQANLDPSRLLTAAPPPVPRPSRFPLLPSMRRVPRIPVAMRIWRSRFSHRRTRVHGCDCADQHFPADLPIKS